MGPKKPKTRQVFKYMVSPCELPVADLPTLRDVLGKCSTEKNKLSNNARIHEVLPLIVQLLRELYCKVNSSLVLHSDKLISQRIQKKYEEMKQINRSKSSITVKAKFEKSLGEVFDIIVCNCKIVPCFDFECPGCEFEAHCFCACDKEFKIPKKELSYVLDQRSRSEGNKGNFQIKGKDVIEMAAMDKTRKKKREQDKTSEAISKEAEKERTETVPEAAVDDPDIQNIDYDNTKDDADFEVPDKLKLKQNRMVLRNLAKECDRWGVSNRAGAAIANAVLIDAGVITSEDQTNVIDKNKLRRSIEDYRTERQVEDTQQLEEKQGHAYYFDGKKTMSLCVEEDEQGKKYNIQRELELISMNAEPGGLYVTHLEPEGGKGEQVAEAVLNFLREHNLDSSWLIVGGDSTAANTGKYIGAFASLEKKLWRRLLWILCMLHLNELPWRHIFVALDGPTSSHNTFLGVIGKILPNVEDLDWSAKVEKVQLGPGLPELPEVVASDLSSDQ